MYGVTVADAECCLRVGGTRIELARAVKPTGMKARRVCQFRQPPTLKQPSGSYFGTHLVRVPAFVLADPSALVTCGKPTYRRFAIAKAESAVPAASIIIPLKLTGP